MGKKHKNFVVFLDVDGVLNTRTTVQQTPKGYQGIDDARVEVLAKTISKFGGADIVLSSDWKELEPTDEDYRYLVSKLALYGLIISGRRTGCTKEVPELQHTWKNIQRSKNM